MLGGSEDDLAEVYFQDLAAEVAGASDNSAAYESWLRAGSKMVVYRTAAVYEVMLQKPSATRIAGVRAWKARGRRLRPGAQPLTITTKPAQVEYLHPVSGEPLPSHLQPYCGPKSKRPPAIVVAQLGRDGVRLLADLPSRELAAAKTQTVYDIADTEKITAPPVDADQDERAQRGIAALVAAGERLGYQVIRGNSVADADDNTALHAHRFLLHQRNAGGATGRITAPDQPTTTFMAAPGGLTPSEELRVLAHEYAHAAFKHLDTHPRLARLEAPAQEVQAEAFAYLVCRAYGVPSPQSSFYIVNHSRHPELALKRASEVVCAGFHTFLSATANA
jgi:hypothetical protein